MVVKLKQGTQIKLDLPGLHHLMWLYPVTATIPYFMLWVFASFTPFASIASCRFSSFLIYSSQIEPLAGLDF